jgi:FkbM family methyltransferase
MAGSYIKSFRDGDATARFDGQNPTLRLLRADQGWDRITHVYQGVVCRMITNVVEKPALRIYPAILRLLGSRSWVQNSRYARYGFMRVLYYCEKAFGTPPGLRTARLSSGMTIQECDLRDNMQAELYYLRSYSNPELLALQLALEPGDTFVDVGANIGLFSVAAAKMVGHSGKVYAFEPAEDSVTQLRKTLVANHLEEMVEIFPVALSDEIGMSPLNGSSDKPFDKGVRSLFQTGPVVDMVKIDRFDRLVEAGMIGIDSQIGAVKIDVEGSELHVLRGMSNTLAHYRPKLVLIEIEESHLLRAGTSPDEVMRFMDEHEFTRLPGRSGDREAHRTVSNVAFVPNERLMEWMST